MLRDIKKNKVRVSAEITMKYDRDSRKPQLRPNPKCFMSEIKYDGNIEWRFKKRVAKKNKNGTEVNVLEWKEAEDLHLSTCYYQVSKRNEPATPEATTKNSLSNLPKDHTAREPQKRKKHSMVK